MEKQNFYIRSFFSDEPLTSAPPNRRTGCFNFGRRAQQSNQERTQEQLRAEQTRRRNRNKYLQGVLIFVLGSLSIFCLVFGCFYIHQCPAQPRIPVYLIVMGILLVLTTMTLYCIFFLSTGCVTSCRNHKEIILFVMVLFDLIWLAIGSIWTLGIVNTVTFKDPTLPTFCDKSLYVATYIFSLGSIFLLLLIACLYISSADKTPTNNM